MKPTIYCGENRNYSSLISTIEPSDPEEKRIISILDKLGFKQTSKDLQHHYTLDLGEGKGAHILLLAMSTKQDSPIHYTIHVQGEYVVVNEEENILDNPPIGELVKTMRGPSRSLLEKITQKLAQEVPAEIDMRGSEYKT